MKCCFSRGLLNQYIAGVAACLSIVNSGTCYTYLTPMLSRLLGPDGEIPLTKMEATWVISVIEVGNLLSPLPAGILSNYVGRKAVILATGPLYILSWLMILWLRTALWLGVARVLQGISMGLTFTAAPVYLGEIASNAARGGITSIFYNSWWVGVLIEYFVGPFLSFENFTYFTLSLNIPFMLLFFWQAESPHYYMMAGNEEKALKSLKWFRDSSPDKLREELEEIKMSIEESSKTVRLGDVVETAEDRKALILFMILTGMRIASGTGGLVVYATEVFDMTPNLSVSSDFVTMGLGVVMLIGGIIGSFTSDTLGRRPLLLISCFGSLFCQFCSGTYYFLLFKTDVLVSPYSWIAPVLIFVYSGMCTAGMYPVCTAYTSELFTSKTRGLASSLGAINVTVFAFLSLVTFQPITDYMGLYLNFYIYSIIIFTGTSYMYLLAPETKGKSFVQIRKELCEMNVLDNS